MKNKWIIVVLIVFIVLCIGIGALVTPNSEKSGDSQVGNELEQKKDDARVSEDKTEESNKGLEVQETYDNNTQDKSDASVNWGDDTTSDVPRNDEINGNQEEQDKDSNPKDTNQEEEILKDDIDWGEIY